MMIDRQLADELAKELQELVVEYEDTDERIDTLASAVLHILDNSMMYHGECQEVCKEDVEEFYYILSELLPRS